MTHTEEQAGAYWTVDLGAVYDIETIKLYNRTDCCAERLDNFTILVTEDGNWNTATLFADGAPYEMNAVRTFTGNSKGRWVRVRLNGTGYLSLAEVEVYGPAAVEIGDEAYGGIVFYVDESGQHGKVVTFDQATEATWDEASVLCANLGYNGYADWYLPSKEDLNMMYSNLHVAGLGGFGDAVYWSSTVNVPGYAICQYFLTGAWAGASKSEEKRVRAARNF